MTDVKESNVLRQSDKFKFRNYIQSTVLPAVKIILQSDSCFKNEKNNLKVTNVKLTNKRQIWVQTIIVIVLKFNVTAVKLKCHSDSCFKNENTLPSLELSNDLCQNENCWTVHYNTSLVQPFWQNISSRA